MPTVFLVNPRKKTKGSGKMNKYNKFFATKRKQGYSAKQIGRMWKKNPSRQTKLTKRYSKSNRVRPVLYKTGKRTYRRSPKTRLLKDAKINPIKKTRRRRNPMIKKGKIKNMMIPKKFGMKTIGVSTGSFVTASLIGYGARKKFKSNFAGVIASAGTTIIPYYALKKYVKDKDVARAWVLGGVVATGINLVFSSMRGLSGKGYIGKPKLLQKMDVVVARTDKGMKKMLLTGIGLGEIEDIDEDEIDDYLFDGIGQEESEDEIPIFDLEGDLGQQESDPNYDDDWGYYGTEEEDIEDESQIEGIDLTS